MSKKTILGFSQDKVLHFIVGFGVAAGAHALDQFVVPHVTGWQVIGIGVTLLLVAALAIGKEIMDYFGPGRVEFADFLVTVLGGLFGVIAVQIIVAIL